MPRRHSPILSGETLFSAAATGFVLAVSVANGQSLCDDFNVPAAHLGHVENCVYDGATTTVSFNSPAILRWGGGFRVDADQNLRFQFNDAAGGTVLNRHLGGGPSLIAGGISSNGRVILLNPGNTISIQNSAVIEADGGFLASTLEVSDEEALLRGEPVEFNGSGGPQSAIDNRGTVRSSAGDIVMISGSVNNFFGGRLAAPNGSVRVGAGTSLRLFGDGIEVLDGDGANVVMNLGDVTARDAVDLSAHAGTNIDGAAPVVVDNSGTIRTTAGDGRVFLRAPGGGRVLNSADGVIESPVLAVDAASFISEGQLIVPNDGGNPAAPSGSRQFPRLAGGNLSPAPVDDFRLSRLSFSHLNGLDTKSKKPSVKPITRAGTKVAVRGASQSKKPASTATKKIILKRGSFFGKKTS